MLGMSAAIDAEYAHRLAASMTQVLAEVRKPPDSPSTAVYFLETVEDSIVWHSYEYSFSGCIV